MKKKQPKTSVQKIANRNISGAQKGALAKAVKTKGGKEKIPRKLG